MSYIDLFEILTDEQLEAEIVICVGGVFHTLRRNQLVISTGNDTPELIAGEPYFNI